MNDRLAALFLLALMLTDISVHIWKGATGRDLRPTCAIGFVFGRAVTGQDVPAYCSTRDER